MVTNVVLLVVQLPMDFNTEVAKNIVEEEAISHLCQLLTCCSNHFSSLLWTFSAEDVTQVDALIRYGNSLFHFYDVLLVSVHSLSFHSHTDTYLMIVLIDAVLATTV